jgi:quercetin dioxygenase-like cupin family protein
MIPSSPGASPPSSDRAPARGLTRCALGRQMVAMPTYRPLLVAAFAAVTTLATAAAAEPTAHAPTTAGTAPMPNPALGAAPSPKPPIMRSQVFDSAHIKADSIGVGERRQVFDAPTVTLERFASHVTTLNPGQAPHPAHRHPEEELMIVKEGTIEATLNGQPTRVDVGGMIFCASNELHGLRNIGTTRATYYVVKWFPHDMPAAAAAAAKPPVH